MWSAQVSPAAIDGWLGDEEKEKRKSKKELVKTKENRQTWLDAFEDQPQQVLRKPRLQKRLNVKHKQNAQMANEELTAQQDKLRSFEGNTSDA